MKRYQRFLFGGRVIKTGISVFITAAICLYFNLPAIFAVITAIVTIEPTASDSIKKGLIRFPASAIGAAISMFFASILGEAALAYALSAMLTIYICHKLKLDAGIIVATITAVAMIPSTEDHFFIAFITRLATTSIGIVVSTIVNIVILPPKFAPLIYKNINEILLTVSDILELQLQQLTNYQAKTKKMIDSLYHKLSDLIEKTNQLCYYQREEFKYHKQKPIEIKTFHYAVKQLNILQLLAFHIGNLTFLNCRNLDFSTKEKDILIKTVMSLIQILKSSDHHISAEHYQLIEELDLIFRKWKENIIEEPPAKYHHHFAPQTIILFELLSIHDALEDLEHLNQSEALLNECHAKA